MEQFCQKCQINAIDTLPKGTNIFLLGGVENEVKISTRWHQLPYSMTGIFDPKYEPFEVCCFVQDRLSPPLKQRYFDDKGLYRFLLNGYKIPQRIAECINGIYYLPAEFGQTEVSYSKFINYIGNLEKCLIKPNIGTDGGRGICAFQTSSGKMIDTGEHTESLVAKYYRVTKGNFAIERRIDECENLQCLNPTSCNSLRIHTYRNKKVGKITYISSYIRIGKLGNIVDNAYSGGICGQIHDDGCIHGAKTVYPYKVFYETEAGVKIDNYKIYGFEKMVKTVVEAHSNLPMFDLIGWDVVIDKDGDVVIIEFNPNPDMKMEQCIFNTSCLLEHQKEVVLQAIGK